MKRTHPETCSEVPLLVNFACVVTCEWNESHKTAADEIAGIQLPEVTCISLAVKSNQTVEMYIECDGLPLTRLLIALKEIGFSCVAIFTFGLNPVMNGAPEALARIGYRVGRCGFAGYLRGTPSLEASLDFDIRDRLTHWIRFTVDQMGLMLCSAASKPTEVIDWCVVACSGNTAMLEGQLKSLKIKTGACRQYYVKGFECMRTPTAARIYLELEPVVKTVLLRCLASELSLAVEIVSFPPNTNALALAWVFELGGVLIEHGNLSDVQVGRQGSCSVTRFTQSDLAVWDCVVLEAQPVHWAVQERDVELARVSAGMSSLRMENTVLHAESLRHTQQCTRFLNALEELKVDRDRLAKELGTTLLSSGIVSWSEYEKLCEKLGEKESCISQLRKQLNETAEALGKLKNDETTHSRTLEAKVKELELKFEAGFEGGVVFDGGKPIRTEGRTWTLVQWQARELELYRSTFGSMCITDCFGNPDFSTGVYSTPS